MATLSANATQTAYVMNDPGSGTTWAAVRAAATGTGSSDSLNDNYPQNMNYGGGNFDLARCFFAFDTSSLGASAIISAATFTFVSNGAGSDSDATSYVLMPSTQGSPISTSDFGAVTFTNCGTLALADRVNGSNVITLNAAGIANINKTGTTKFALSFLLDQANTSPTGYNFADIRSSTVPVLEITYTLPSPVYRVRPDVSIGVGITV